MVSSKQMRQIGREYWANRLLTDDRREVIKWLCKYLDGPSLHMTTEIDTDFYEGLQRAIISDKKFAVSTCEALAASTRPPVIGAFMDMLEFLWKHDQGKARELFTKVQLSTSVRSEVRGRIDDYLEGDLPQDFRAFLERSRP